MNLSPEVVIHILRYLNIEDLIKVRLVHIQWYDIVNDYRFYINIRIDDPLYDLYQLAPAAPKDGFGGFMMWYNKYLLSRFEVLHNSYGLMDAELTMYKLCFYLDSLRKLDTTVQYIRTVEHLLIGFDVIRGNTDLIWELIYGQIKIASNRNGWGSEPLEIFKTKFYSDSPILVKYSTV